MKRWWRGVFVLFLLILGIRLFFAFQTPFFSADRSYLHIRVIESLREGHLLRYDPLGFGGRTLIMSPIFDTILAFFSLFMPLQLVLKIIPNIFASLLVFPAFLICYRLTDDSTLSLCGAFLASIVPGFIAHTFNQVTPLTIVVPIFFALTYAWLTTPRHIGIFLALLFFFVFLDPLAILFVISIGIYLALATIDKIKRLNAEYELGLFSIFFTLWALFLLYKRLILFHGPNVIWQNIPDGSLSSFYSNITILGMIVQIGAYPLAEGIYALYKTAFKTPQKEIDMLLSITIVSGVLLWLKLIDVSTGVMFLGVTLAILFSKWTALSIKFLKTTKLSRYARHILAISILLAFISTAIPAYGAIREQLNGTITQEEVTALVALSRSTPENATIIAPVGYGNYVTAIAKRKNVIDDYFFLQRGINERYEDVSRVYKTQFVTEAVELFDKYHAQYLIVPPGVKDVRYADSSCFKRIHATNVRAYEKRPDCVIKVIA